MGVQEIHNILLESNRCLEEGARPLRDSVDTVTSAIDLSIESSGLNLESLSLPIAARHLEAAHTILQGLLGEAPEYIRHVNDHIANTEGSASSTSFQDTPTTHPSTARPLSAEAITEMTEEERAYLERQRNIERLLAGGTPPEAIPGYINKGFERLVFDAPGGKVIKVPAWGPGTNYGTREESLKGQQDYVTALQKVTGESDVEQLVTFIPDNNGAVVCEKVPGKTLRACLKEGDIPSIEHLILLLRRFPQIVQKVDADYHPTNLMYDVVGGFTHIDVHDKYPDEPLRSPEYLGQQLARHGLMDDDIHTYDEHGGPIMMEMRRRVFGAYRQVFGDAAVAELRNLCQRNKIPVPPDI